MLDADRSASTRLAPGRCSSVRVNTSADRRALVLRLEESELHGPAATTTVFPGVTMIATCANPACNIPFRYFRSGQIFMVEANDNHVDPRSRADHPKRRIEYFWLCGECAPTMHLMRTTDGAVIICQVRLRSSGCGSKNRLCP